MSYVELMLDFGFYYCTATRQVFGLPTEGSRHLGLYPYYLGQPFESDRKAAEYCASISVSRTEFRERLAALINAEKNSAPQLTTSK
jgi:hypothetical protein